MKYEVRSLYGKWGVWVLLPAINGLSAWVQIADCGKPDPEDQMFEGFDPQRNAEMIAAALNAQPSP